MSYDIKVLLNKYKKGNLSIAEKEYLFRWYNSYSDSKLLGEHDDTKLKEDIDELSQLKWIDKNSSAPSMSYRWLLIAGCLLLCGFISLLLLKNNIYLSSDYEIVKAGTQQAELRLFNGEKVSLDSLTAFTSIEKGNVKITKNKDGMLQYTSISNTEKENVFDELVVPKAGEYQIQLVDGTKVWLNANSKIRFFTNDFANTREVWLEGEGYFEVKKNLNRPFFVYTNQQTVRVTGTSFNILSSPSKTQTTLLEGGVSINNNSRILRPNEQLTTLNNIDGSIKSVDVQEVVAWKNGYFMFNDRLLNEVIKELEEWYDVKFVCKGELKNHKIWATMSKYKDIDEVLHTIQLTEVAKFKRIGRRVEVTQ